MRLQHKNHIRPCAQDYVFYSVNTLLIVLFTLIIAYPLLFVIFASFDGGAGTLSVNIWPSKWSDAGYRAVFEYGPVWIGYRNSLLYTVVGALFGLIFCVCAAYPLAQPNLDGRNLFMGLFVFTMYFGGGLIPTYLLISNLGMLDTIWAILIPGAFSVWNMIIARTYYMGIPHDMQEAAEIDGASEMVYFFKILLPLCMPIIATIAMWQFVGMWNSYFDAMIYLNDAAKQPLQLVLRAILIQSQPEPGMVSDMQSTAARAQLAELLKYATIIISSVPLMILYPFFQKYFDSGIMAGAVKG